MERERSGRHTSWVLWGLCRSPAVKLWEISICTESKLCNTYGLRPQFETVVSGASDAYQLHFGGSLSFRALFAAFGHLLISYELWTCCTHLLLAICICVFTYAAAEAEPIMESPSLSRWQPPPPRPTSLALCSSSLSSLRINARWISWTDISFTVSFVWSTTRTCNSTQDGKRDTQRVATPLAPTIHHSVNHTSSSTFVCLSRHHFFSSFFFLCLLCGRNPLRLSSSPLHSPAWDWGMPVRMSVSWTTVTCRLRPSRTWVANHCPSSRRTSSKRTSSRPSPRLSPLSHRSRWVASLFRAEARATVLQLHPHPHQHLLRSPMRHPSQLWPLRRPWRTATFHLRRLHSSLCPASLWLLSRSLHQLWSRHQLFPLQLCRRTTRRPLQWCSKPTLLRHPLQLFSKPTQHQLPLR